MSAAGVALLGNMWALLMFGLGLLIAQYTPGLLRLDLFAHHIPHGLMIGAGSIALLQALHLLRTSRTTPTGQRTATAAADTFQPQRRTVSMRRVRTGLCQGFVLFVAGAVLVALTGGLSTGMSTASLCGWVLLAAGGALVHQLIIGLAAMHSGWFPAFAVTLIFLTIGLLAHIPSIALAMLVGYVASTGPAFADMGFDLKAGWLLRIRTVPWLPAEKAGRLQQYRAELLGFLIAVAVVAWLWQPFFTQGRIPPLAKIYTATIKTGLTDPGILTQLALWALPGAALQLLGGPSRQMGVLLATGLLVAAPQAGWLVLLALLTRVLYNRRSRRTSASATDAPGPDGRSDDPLTLIGAGLIAGSSLYDLTQIRKAL